MEGLEKLTLENLFENREIFQNVCKEKNMYQYDYNRLVKSKSKKGFMQIVGANFHWLYQNVCKFGLDYDKMSDFNGGISEFTKSDITGYLTMSGEVLELEKGYKVSGGLRDGLIRVFYNGKYGFISYPGYKIVIPAIYEFIYGNKFLNGKILVKMESNNYFFINRKGKKVEDSDITDEKMNRRGW